MSKDKDNLTWNSCNTLQKVGKFEWRYDDNKIIINHSHGRFSHDRSIIDCIVNYLDEKNCKIPLGAAGTGNVPEHSLGAYLESKKIQGFSRPQCSYLAAILVNEGLIEFDNLGQGPGRGLWIYPGENDSVTNFGKFDKNEHSGANKLDNYFEQISRNLTSLANDISETKIAATKSWNFEFSNINYEKISMALKEIKAWEQERLDSHYIYKISTNEQATALDIYEAYLESKSINEDQLAYARVNIAHRGELTIYVGSSKSITQRLKGHFGFGYPKTFSLQMSSWSNKLKGGIIIDVYCFDSRTSQSVVQTIEDGCWSLFKPMFGRQGQK